MRFGSNFCLFYTGVKDQEQVKIFTAQDTAVISAKESGKVQAKTVRIGNDIIRVASLYVREEIRKAIKKVQEKLPSDISKEEFMKLLRKDEDFEFWSTALYRVEGEDPHVPWRYIIIDSPIANAFVSEILPQVSFAVSVKSLCILYLSDSVEYSSLFC